MYKAFGDLAFGLCLACIFSTFRVYAPRQLTEVKGACNLEV